MLGSLPSNLHILTYLILITRYQSNVARTIYFPYSVEEKFLNPRKAKTLAQVAQLVSGVAGILTQETWLQHLAHKHFSNKAHNFYSLHT